MTCTSLSHQWLSSIIFKIIVNVAWALTSSAMEDNYNMNRQTWRHDNIFNEIYDENWLQSWKCTVHVHYTYVLCTYIKSMGIFLIGVCNMIGGLSANLIGRVKAQLGNFRLFGNLCAIFLGVVVVMLSNNCNSDHLTISLRWPEPNPSCSLAIGWTPAPSFANLPPHPFLTQQLYFG